MDHSAAISFEELYDEASGDLACGDLAGAAAKYRCCTELDPESADAWHALGMTLYKLRDLTPARGAALMATTLRPNDLLAWTALSQIYVAEGRIADAEDAKGKARILSLGGKVSRS